LVPLL